MGGGVRYNDYVDSKYFFLTLRDSYSRYYDAIPLKYKSDAAKELKNWITQQNNFLETCGGYKFYAVRTDNGDEFTRLFCMISSRKKVLNIN